MTPEAVRSRGRLAGVGCDTEERARLEDLLARDSAFLRRWFTAAEQAAIDHATDGPELALILFCLKEAAVKSLWRHVPASLPGIEALPAPEGFRLRVLDPRGAALRLEGQCRSDARHAWAEVLAFFPPLPDQPAGNDNRAVRAAPPLAYPGRPMRP